MNRNRVPNVFLDLLALFVVQQSLAADVGAEVSTDNEALFVWLAECVAAVFCVIDVFV